MAKSIVSDKWFVRVDGNEEFLTQKLKILADCLDTKVLHGLFHLGERRDNSHTHFVIQTSPSQKQSFAVRIKKLFDIVKKNDYAIEIWDGIPDGGAVSYMYHEENAKVLFSKGISQEEIDRAIALNKKVQEVVSVNKKRASGKLVEKALEHFDFNSQPERREVLLFMLKEINKGDSYHPGEFRLKSFVEEVIIKKSNASELEEYARLCEARMWRDI